MSLVNEHFLKLPNNYLFADIAKKVNISDVAKNDYSLSIPLYIQTGKDEEVDERTVQECYEDWKEASTQADRYFDLINEILDGGAEDGDC